MCVAYPARVTTVSAHGTAMVEAYGRLVRVALLALDEPVAPGDWLLVHSGIALARLEDTEAWERQRLIDQTGGTP